MALLPVCQENVQGRAPVPMMLLLYSKPSFQMAGLQMEKPTESAFLTMAPFSHCSRAQDLRGYSVLPFFFLREHLKQCVHYV